jgi:hypothetical protein
LEELRLARYLRERWQLSGSAVTAVTFTLARQLLKLVLHVFTHRHTLSLRNGISKYRFTVKLKRASTQDCPLIIL